MEDSEWHEVKRRKNRSVFDRLGSPLNRNYKPIEFGKEMVSVYVSNFPSHLTIDNKEVLIDSLNKIWIGKLRLHANIARFDRKVGVKHVHADVKRQVLYDYKPIEHCKTQQKSYANMVNSQHTEDRKVNKGEPVIENPSIMLSQEASSRLSLALIGCYKDFRAINSRITCRNEGFVDSFLKHEGVLSWFSLLKPWHDDFVVKDRLIWLELEGVPLLAWNNDTFKKIGSRWGEGVSYAIRVRELCSWTPSFSISDEENEEEQSVGRYGPVGLSGWTTTSISTV
ncbi:hypothetical protein Tco_1375288 [Tanacetum coccineum]